MNMDLRARLPISNASLASYELCELEQVIQPLCALFLNL